MPAARANTYLSKLKKHVQLKKSTASTGGTALKRGGDAPTSAEEVKRAKQKMRKYIEKASA